MKTKLTKEELEQALPLALELYKGFFNELTTAMSNSIKNFERAMWSTEGANHISYYMGKRAAFQEISQRLHKEYMLPLNYTHYLEVEKGFKIVRDKDIEKVYPETEWIGKSDYNKAMIRRRALGEMLEHYFMEGFAIANALAKGQDTKEYNPEEFATICIDHLIDPYYKDKEIKL